MLLEGGVAGGGRTGVTGRRFEGTTVQLSLSGIGGGVVEIVVSTMGSSSSSAESSSGGGMSGSSSGNGTQVSRGTVIVVGRTGLGGGVVGEMIAAVEGGGGAGGVVVGVSGGETGWLWCGGRAVSGSFGCQPKGITVSSRGVKILRKIIRPLARRKVWQ